MNELFDIYYNYFYVIYLVKYYHINYNYSIIEINKNNIFKVKFIYLFK